MKSLAVQAKAITGGLTAAIGAAAAVVTALNVHAAWVPVLIAVATALGVYGGVHRVPNRPQAGPGTSGFTLTAGEAAAIKRLLGSLNVAPVLQPGAPVPPPAAGSGP